MKQTQLKIQQDEVVIRRPSIKELMNEKYIPYIDSKRPRYLNFLGGRGSGKSYAAAFIIVMRLMTHKFFRGLGLRKYDNDTKDSIYQTIIDVIDILDLRPLFEILKSPKSITCIKTGNFMLFGGQNEPSSIKSFREGTFLLFEEEVAETYDKFTTMARTFRTTKADFIQVMHCINPVLPGDPTEHWFYKHFGYAEHTELSFTDTVSGEIDGNIVSFDVTSLQTTYRDNKFLDPVYKLELESETDTYKYAVDTLGIWARQEIEDRFYKSFDIKTNVGEFQYDRDKHLHIGVDFNSYPFTTIVVFQGEGKKLWQIDEICVNDKKESSIDAACKEFATRYKDHYLDVYLYGDATAKKQDAAQKKGVNMYSYVFNNLTEFKIINMVPDANPPVSARREFTNKIFLNNYKDILFVINKKCTNTVNDFYAYRADEHGDPKKEYVTDKSIDPPKKYEKWGHCSDAATYILCKIYTSEFSELRFPKKSYDILTTGDRSNNKWSY